MARGSHLHLMACYQRPYIFILLCCAKLLVLQSTSAFLSLHDAKCKVSRLSQAVSEHEASSISDGFDTNDHIHLFSLKWTPDERISKPVRDVWRWKDASLGDGRDFFVPKPKTIRSLQDYIIENSQSIDECVVLSNCARLEIICVTNENNDNPSLEIARCLAAQVFSSLNNRPQLLQSMLVQHLDLPHIAIDTNADITSTCLEDVMAINKHWIHVRGCEAVCRHICLVAAGIAPRPRRPDREVLFRPFSSRDSHILLQLKRTREAATGASANILIEYAQRAGKAARSVEQVPEIEQLREYGSGDSKYSTDPPLQLSQLVAEVGTFVLNCDYQRESKRERDNERVLFEIGVV